jgi:hypothetical protein
MEFERKMIAIGRKVPESTPEHELLERFIENIIA